MNLNRSQVAVRRPVLACLLSQSLLISFGVYAAEPQGDPILRKSSQAQPISTQQSADTKPKAAPLKAKGASASKRFVQKLILPLNVTFVELSHPVELFKSVRQRLWSNSLTSDFDEQYATRLTGVHAFEIEPLRIAEYNFNSESRNTESRNIVLYRYIMPLGADSAKDIAAPYSKTQLQVRMRDDWSVLYEIIRANPEMNFNEIGVGLSLRYSF